MKKLMIIIFLVLSINSFSQVITVIGTEKRSITVDSTGKFHTSKWKSTKALFVFDSENIIIHEGSFTKTLDKTDLIFPEDSTHLFKGTAMYSLLDLSSKSKGLFIIYRKRIGVLLIDSNTISILLGSKRTEYRLNDQISISGNSVKK